MATITEKKCKGICGEIKPLDEFHKDASSKDGKTACCKECNRKRSREYQSTHAIENVERNRRWYQANPEKRGEYRKRMWSIFPEREQDRRLKYFFNMSLEGYWTMLGDQGDGCGVCAVQEPTGRSDEFFHVDHDHNCCDSVRSCGLCVRGIVCSRCNTHVIPIFEGRKVGDIGDLSLAVQNYMDRYQDRRKTMELLATRQG